MTCARALSVLMVVGGLSGSASLVNAETRGSFVTVHRADPVPTESGPTLVINEVIEPAATVSRELADQPVHPYLMRVRVVDMTTNFDPESDYQNAGRGRLDDSHFIVRAQQLHRSLTASSVEVFGPRRVMKPTGLGGVRPQMILLKPPQLRPVPNPNKEDGNIPSVPEAKPTKKQMASIATD